MIGSRNETSASGTILFVQLALLALIVAPLGASTSLAPGDLILGGRPGYQTDTGDGFVLKYSPAGVFAGTVAVLNRGHPRDMIDVGGVVIVADQDHLSAIAREGTVWLAVPVFFDGLAGSLAVDASDNIYVGDLLGRGLTKVAAGGSVAQTWTLPAVFPEIIALDLQPDQCTILYGSGSLRIQRYNVCTSAAMSDFGSIPSGGVISIRILPDGDVLAASTTGVFRFDKSGQWSRSYANGTAVCCISLVPGETSMWIAGAGMIEKIDLLTGSVIIGPLSEAQPVKGVGYGSEALLVLGDRRAAQNAGPSVPKRRRAVRSR